LNHDLAALTGGLYIALRVDLATALAFCLGAQICPAVEVRRYLKGDTPSDRSVDPPLQYRARLGRGGFRGVFSDVFVDSVAGG
jgi:hypothetical protein